MTYDTAFYHSTWSSAFIEGAVAGLKAGLSVEKEDDKFVRLKKEYAYAIMLQVFGVDGRNYPHPPFCMKYDASIERVKSKIPDILAAIGNPLVKGNAEYGLFGTEFKARAYQAARWRDRYIINVGETISGKTVVTIFRGLFIARGGEPFVRAESDGYNEAWILKRLAAELR